MIRPRILYDLFCKAGGATRGYQQAGFYVVGVDHEPQPNYVGDEFILADALEVDLSRAHAIHASPPCQLYSAANNIHQRTDHPDLVEPMRRRLQAAGVPYVIENVPRSPLEGYVVLCGLAFPELNVKRHRWFECSFPVLVPPCGDHSRDYLIVFGGSPRKRARQIGRTAKNGPILRRGFATADEGRAAMGIDWMTRDELSEAIPPAYTRYIGEALRVHLEHAKGTRDHALQDGRL